MKFRKCVTKGEFVLFRSTIYTNKSTARKIQFIIFNFIRKAFFVSTYIENVVVKLEVSRLGFH